MNKNLTIIIPSYNSKKLVIKHLKNLAYKFNIIIIENSHDVKLKKLIKNKYKNVVVHLKKNIGFGRAINYGARFVKTRYFFVINPDTKIYKNTIKNLILAAKKIPKFGMISSEHIKNKNNQKKKLLIEKKMLNGAAMFLQTETFKKIGGFDKNIFLYYEENDFFKRCNRLKLKLFTVTNSFHFHSLTGDSTSSIFYNSEQKNHSILISGWHGQWSKFYYLRKYHGYFYSFAKCMPSIFYFIIKIIFNLLVNHKKAKYNYFKLEGLIFSMLSLPSFKRSKFDNI